MSGPRHRVWLVGAGYSKPAGGPTIDQLFEEVQDYGRRADLPYVTATRNYIKAKRTDDNLPEYSLEDFLTDLTRLEAIGQPLRTGYSGSEDAGEVLESITAYIRARCSSIHLRRGSSLWAGYVHHMTSTINSSTTLTIICFNYDLLTEQILEDAAVPFNYGLSPDIRPVSKRFPRRSRGRRPKVTLLKLHGSLNWGLCQRCPKSRHGGDVASVFRNVYPRVNRKRCPWCGRGLLDGGIIPPMTTKSHAQRRLRMLWTQAAGALRDATEITVIGYRLGHADPEVRELLRVTEHRPTNPPLVVICGSRGGALQYGSLDLDVQDQECYYQEFLKRRGYL